MREVTSKLLREMSAGSRTHGLVPPWGCWWGRGQRPLCVSVLQHPSTMRRWRQFPSSWPYSWPLHTLGCGPARGPATPVQGTDMQRRRGTTHESLPRRVAAVALLPPAHLLPYVHGRLLDGCSSGSSIQHASITHLPDDRFPHRPNLPSLRRPDPLPFPPALLALYFAAATIAGPTRRSRPWMSSWPATRSRSRRPALGRPRTQSSGGRCRWVPRYACELVHSVGVQQIGARSSARVCGLRAACSVRAAAAWDTGMTVG